MANEFKLSYTAKEIDDKLGEIDNAVKITAQTLTDEQKAQARANIGALSSTYKSDWADIQNKPFITEGGTVRFDSVQSLTVEQKAQARENIGLTNTALEDFMQNVDVDYAYDASTGVNYTVVRVYKQKIDGTYQYPFVVAPDGSNEQTHTALKTAKEYGYLLTINAGLFTGSPCLPDGVIVQDSQVIINNPSVHYAGAIPLTIDASGNLGYASSEATGEELVASGIVSAVCGFCPIIVNYSPIELPTVSGISHFTENAQRQIIGQFGNGDYAIVTCEGRGYQNSDGWTLAEAQAICSKLGLKFAYNLDGGGSTETVLGKKQINTVYENATGRIVPTFIVFNGTNSLSGVPVAEAYTMVESVYIDNCDYIDTGIPETEVFTIEYKWHNAVKWEAANGHILSSANNYTSFGRWRVDNDGKLKSAIVTKTKGVEKFVYVDYDTNNPIIVQQNVNGNTVEVKVNDATVTTFTMGNAASENNKYYLFAYGGNPTSTNYSAVGRFYYLKMWDSNGKLVRNYKAAKRNSDGIYGVYDTVQGVFYKSQGTTEIEA